jgi:hypothetical protein
MKLKLQEPKNGAVPSSAADTTEKMRALLEHANRAVCMISSDAR